MTFNNFINEIKKRVVDDFRPINFHKVNYNYAALDAESKEPEYGKTSSRATFT